MDAEAYLKEDTEYLLQQEEAGVPFKNWPHIVRNSAYCPKCRPEWMDVK